jgi:DNA-directed RNA polymerase specialized sigma24 family protein
MSGFGDGDGMGPTDEDLAREAAGGDRRALARLLDRHYDRLHRMAWRMTGSRADAEDVVQDVCLALVGGSGRNPPSRPGSPPAS